MKVCIPTDEVDANPIKALELITSLGLSYIELRGIYGERLPDGDPAQVRSFLEELRSTSFEVAALSPGVFKVPHTDRQEVRRHLEKRLPDSLDLARKLDTSTIIVFGLVGDPAEPWDRRWLVELLRSAAGRAEDSGCVLALENEPICLVDTASSAASIIAEVDRESLKANWDPSNAKLRGEDAVPTGFEAIRPYITHVHLKDYLPWVEHKRPAAAGGTLSIEADRSDRYVPLGEGIVGIRQVLQALAEMGYSRFTSLETHIAAKEWGARASVAAARKLMAELRIPFE
ncbi:MAG: sugar phosphate isomerase/epimerase [Candidatus Bathyarchaeia archaeon]